VTACHQEAQQKWVSSVEEGGQGGEADMLHTPTAQMSRTNELATGVQQRASRIARIDGCIGLDHVLNGPPCVA